jgi:hypothetical protein
MRWKRFIKNISSALTLFLKIPINIGNIIPYKIKKQPINLAA